MHQPQSGDYDCGTLTGINDDESMNNYKMETRTKDDTELYDCDQYRPGVFHTPRIAARRSTPTARAIDSKQLRGRARSVLRRSPGFDHFEPGTRNSPTRAACS